MAVEALESGGGQRHNGKMKGAGGAYVRDTVGNVTYANAGTPMYTTYGRGYGQGSSYGRGSGQDRGAGKKTGRSTDKWPCKACGSTEHLEPPQMYTTERGIEQNHTLT